METNKGDEMSDFYRFPAMADLGDWEADQQMCKIISERREADEALEKYLAYQRKDDPDYMVEHRLRKAYGMELMDLIHAVETALRIEFFDGEVEQLHAAVEKKNRERGYYEA